MFMRNRPASSELIADLGVAHSVDVSKSVTNGWKDLICNYTYEVGTRLAANIFKFNETITNIAKQLKRENHRDFSCLTTDTTSCSLVDRRSLRQAV